MGDSDQLYSGESLRSWIAAAFRAVDLTEVDAAEAASLLVQTSLWGIDSHGVARVPHYLERLRRGSVVAKPVGKFTATGAATGDFDGGHGFGFNVCASAMRHAIELARASGAGIVGVRNSSHCGAVGLYSRMAADQGMIGLSFTHADAYVAPPGAAAPFFGTNPISISIPSIDPARPFCVDLATSAVTVNRIMNARRDNAAVPSGLGIDRAGRETTNPHDIVALHPMAGHKGYALAFAIDMLCGPLNGMTFGPHINRMHDDLDNPRRLGSLLIAFDPARFFGGADLARTVTQAIVETKSLGETVRYPGEPEYLAAEQREREGIPLPAALRQQFAEWASHLALAPLEPALTTVGSCR